MSSKEELSAAIAAKGDEIRVIKTEKPPDMKDLIAPLVAELNALKLQYKEVTGEDFGPKPEEKKKKNEPQQQEKKSDGPSKSELNKLKRKEKKAAAVAAKAAEKGEDPNQQQNQTNQTTTVVDESLAHLYGDLPLICSATMTDKVYVDIGELTADLVGQTVWIRGRLHQTRAVGKGVFIVLRQTVNTVQGVIWQSENVPKAMVKYAAAVPLESVVDVLAHIIVPDAPVTGATVKGMELQVQEVHTVSRAQDLPFMIEDAGRSAADAEATGLPTVAQDVALNFRWVDTRTPANQAIFRIQSGVCQLFRNYFLERNFIEIHTPKLIGGASEGGANVFQLKYFNSSACLAQSPQLYKQMVCACGGFERVFEIGPVFRAEDSNTHRHLCEFTGLDFEMAIQEHYYEALDVMGGMFNYIFDGITEKFAHELMLISQQYPFEPLKYLRPPLRITFEEGITMLKEAGIEASYDEDIGTTQEKALGKLVAEKYNTDFYMMDKYPLAARPFYTMPDPANPKVSNSYDLFIRGEEIVSGAQRIHDIDLLIERAKEWGVPLASIQNYIDAFKHGALPHAGGGIGLERVVMLYLGLKNIRKTSMFPRDPSRLTP